MCIQIDRKHRPCLDEQVRTRGGSEPKEQVLPGKELAMPTRRIALDVIEEVLSMRHECRHSQREIVRIRAVGRGGEPVAAARDGGGLGWPLSADPDA